MKFFDLEGKQHSKDISRYKIDKRSRGNVSKGQRELGDRLQGLFPNLTIYEELPCLGTRMRLDFYIHTLGLALEFDGKQHEEYSAFLHGSKSKFLEAKQRDYEKEEWCKINHIRLIRVKHNQLDNLENLINES